MHVPSGLFVQGHYSGADLQCAGHVANGYWGSAGGATKKDTTHWLIQAGISKNWFGIGNTALYGEYGVATDWGAEAVGRNFAGNSAVNCPNPNAVCSLPALQNFTTVNGVTDTELTIWGMGITQNVDAAASTLYLGYRNSDADITCTGAAGAEPARVLQACRNAQEPADRADPRHHRWRGREVLRTGRRGAIKCSSGLIARAWNKISTRGGCYESHAPT